MDDRSVAIKGGLWTGMSTVVTLLTQMLRLIILTRFLDKSDFGVVSITNTVIMLCLTFTDLGFASVIMYKKDLNKEEFSSLFWIQAILFTFLYLLLIIASPFIASYYDSSVLNELIIVSGLSIIGQAIGKLYDSVLLKAYYFKSLAFRNIVTNFFSLALALLLAILGFGVYSLILSTLFQVLMYNVWNIITGYKIQPLGLVLNIKKIFPLIKIGIFETGTHIFDFIANKIDVMIIGKLLGMEALGVYDLAKELVLKFMSLIRTVVSKVALPIIANNNTDDDAVRTRFLSMTKVVAYICIPVCFTLAVFSEPIIRIVYGVKFLDAIPLVSVFSITTMIGCISSFFDMLGIAKGRTDLNFKYTIFRIVITIPVVVFTSMISILAVSIGHLAVGLIGVVVYWYIVVNRTYPITVKLYLSQFDKMLIITAIICILFMVLKKFGVLSFTNIVEFNYIIEFIIFFIFLLLGYYLFMKNEIKVFVDNLRKYKINN